MAGQQLTYEKVLELIRENSQEFSRSLKEQGAEFDRLMKNQGAEFDRRMKERDAEFDKIRQETSLQIKETALQIKATDNKISKLGSRIGDIVEHMIGGRIVDKFQALGYEIKHYTRNHYFEMSKLGINGEIDLILHDGDISILIEVKTSLGVAEVMKHIETMGKYRIYADARWKDTTRYIGAVAGVVVTDEAMNFAHENGLYTIVQSGEAVDIVPVPESFRAKEW